MPTEPRRAPAQTVLITGASSGIGRATAQRFARRGARLVLVARGRSSLEETAAEVREAGAADVLVCPADVADEAALRAVVEGAVDRFGSLDVVVHAAQVIGYGRIEDIPREAFEAVVRTGVHGTANLARLVLPVFRRQGRGHLVVLGSLLASVTAPLMGSYAVAKWAQQALVRTLQQETRDVPGISISMVSPGGVSTPIYTQAGTWIGRSGRPPLPYSAERVARTVVAQLDRPRRLVQAGLLNPVIIAGFRLLPGLYDALVGPLLRTVALSRDEVPPNPGNIFESRPEGNAVHGRWRGF
jgi:NAD(P)-dependent dehydrogenase (short-subunit alcohol dehydrogenase family)